MGKIFLLAQRDLKQLTTSVHFRYVVFGTLVVCVLFLYIIPSLFKFNRWMSSGRIASCMEAELYELKSLMHSRDVLVVHKPQMEGESLHVLPVSGNGLLLVSLIDGELYTRHRRTLSMPSQLGVLFNAELAGNSGGDAEDINLVNVRDGYVQSLRCYTGFDHPVVITSKVYAHRTQVNLVVQEMSIRNPTSHPVTIHVNRLSKSSVSGDLVESTLGSYSTASSRLSVENTKFFSRRVTPVNHGDSPQPSPGQLDNDTYVYALQTGLPKDEIIVQSGRTESIVVLTLVDINLVGKDMESPSGEQERKKAAQQDLIRQMDHIDDVRTLFRGHSEASRKLFATGFGISESKAPEAINGDRVNLTLHYIASHFQALAAVAKNPAAINAAEKAIVQADKCYDDHFTLQHSRLWEMPKTIDQYFDFSRMWIITLEKHGCRDLIASVGADASLAAMVMSFGGLRFTQHHLEFAIHPSDLHRDLMHFRGLPVAFRMSMHVTVNISVQIDTENKAQLYVTVDPPDVAYYGCDAGCLDAPVQLGRTPTRFPVKLTEPLMPILYITDDKSHMVELKDALHIRSIQEAPAHEDDVIALHKHGHQLGGLPLTFWITIILLIVIFHGFLIKLIISEYNKSESRYSPVPTNPASGSSYRMSRLTA